MTTLANGKVVDLRDGSIRETPVRVESGRIAAFDSDGNGGETIDLDGAYLVPGLINCHTHLSIVFPFHETNENESPAITAIRCQRRAIDALRGGVTTVRTVGEIHRADIALRTMIEEGWAEGPRIISAGKSISTTGGHGSGFGALIADGADAFRRAAREEFAAGADHIKIFITGGIAQRGETLAEPQMSIEEIEAVVEVARSRGSYVCAHSGGQDHIRKAAGAGVRCFEHAYQLDRETCEVIRDSGACVVPTLSVTRSPEWMKDNQFEPWTIEKAVAAGPGHLESIRTAVETGVQLINGTDMPPGALNDGVNATVREMAFMVEAGLTPLQSLRATTICAAELMGRQKDFGAIEEGLSADLVAVRQNPLEDIRAMEAIFFVMKEGLVVRRENT